MAISVGVVEMLVALVGSLSPIYFLLFRMNRSLGMVCQKTESVERRVRRLEEREG